MTDQDAAVDQSNRTENAEQERAKREVEAEAVGYVVGRYFGLDTSGSAFYLAGWRDDDAETLQSRLGRISSTAELIINAIDDPNKQVQYIETPYPFADYSSTAFSTTQPLRHLACTTHRRSRQSA